MQRRGNPRMAKGPAELPILLRRRYFILWGVVKLYVLGVLRYVFYHGTQKQSYQTSIKYLNYFVQYTQLVAQLMQTRHLHRFLPHAAQLFRIMQSVQEIPGTGESFRRRSRRISLWNLDSNFFTRPGRHPAEFPAAAAQGTNLQILPGKSFLSEAAAARWLPAHACAFQ